ncbi:MAG: heme exporter protein CcmD [Zoogloeaceae bacterium]|jgi:heme exporter protein D|nr:heme exporter protein CcmD [Zoogloeaceae bacterium]
MYWNSFSDFLRMGGYGLYVWGSFGMTALVMTLEPWLALRRQRLVRQRLSRQWRAEERRKTNAGTGQDKGGEAEGKAAKESSGETA